MGSERARNEPFVVRTPLGKGNAVGHVLPGSPKISHPRQRCVPTAWPRVPS